MLNCDLSLVKKKKLVSAQWHFIIEFWVLFLLSAVTIVINVLLAVVLSPAGVTVYNYTQNLEFWLKIPQINSKFPTPPEL